MKTFVGCRNGDKYAGEYFADKIHGFGVYHFANGHCYEGSWHEGKKQGYGMYTFRNGDTRCGDWDAGILKMPLCTSEPSVQHAVQAAQKAAESSILVPRVDSQVNKAVAAANRAATAARVAAIKAVQNRIDGKFCDINEAQKCNLVEERMTTMLFLRLHMERCPSASLVTQDMRSIACHLQLRENVDSTTPLLPPSSHGGGDKHEDANLDNIEYDQFYSLDRPITGGGGDDNKIKIFDDSVYDNNELDEVVDEVGDDVLLVLNIENSLDRDTIEKKVDFGNWQAFQNFFLKARANACRQWYMLY
ncbi:hypothetical protein ZIOFF_033203 [Zingiber officinale]|uniref:Uncharacterized protein n=1 Tax=Zingiber officinale TaxID=94328 RepID=A0A8J5GNT8_ZINOF|nr:hypothetical protein ZIOFF_033203 [Zingiber officinale]